jgi:ParB-like chromosome segregation protein Spo0J
MKGSIEYTTLNTSRVRAHGLDPLDEAEAYQALKEMGYSLTAIGRRLGKSRPYVSQRVKLLRLHPKLRKSSDIEQSPQTMRTP